MNKETSTTLLQDLKDKSSSLDTLIYDFANTAISRKLQIRCFYETRSTQIANAVSRRIAKFFPLKVQVYITIAKRPCFIY